MAICWQNSWTWPVRKLTCLRLEIQSSQRAQVRSGATFTSRLLSQVPGRQMPPAPQSPSEVQPAPGRVPPTHCWGWQTDGGWPATVAVVLYLSVGSLVSLTRTHPCAGSYTPLQELRSMLSAR